MLAKQVLYHFSYSSTTTTPQLEHFCVATLICGKVAAVLLTCFFVISENINTVKIQLMYCFVKKILLT
jgi:hypothetical protein